MISQSHLSRKESISLLHTFLTGNAFFWLYFVFLAGFFIFPSASTLAYYYSLFILAPLLLFWRELQPLLHRNLLFYLSAIYIGYMTLTTVWGEEVSLEGVLLTAWHGLQILGFILVTGLIWRRWRNRVDWVLSRLVWLAAAAALLSMIVWYGQHEFPKERLQTLGIMHHEVKAACAYGVFALISLSRVQARPEKAEKALYILLCLVLVAVVLLGQSRTALAALILGSMVLLGWRSLLLVVPLGLTSLYLFSINPQLWADRVSGSSFRLGIWQATIESFRHHLVIGTGYLNDVTVQAYGRTFDHAHSAYLATLRDGGLVGLMLLLVLSAAAAYRALSLWNSKPLRLYAALLVFGGACLLLDFDRLITRPKELWLFFWWPLAVLAIQPGVKPQQPDRR